MGILRSEWRDRLDHWRRTLRDDLYEPLGYVEWKGACTHQQLTLQEAETLPLEPMPQGTVWGTSWDYCWLFGTVTLPRQAEGKRIVMWLNPGGEATLFVNGRPFGTRRAPWVKEPYHFVEDNTLSHEAKAGDTYRIAAEVCAAGYFPVVPGYGEATGPVLPGSFQDPKQEGKRTAVEVSTYGIWHEEAYQLLMDVETLNHLLDVVDEDSLRASKIADALEEFTRIVDFEQAREGRLNDYRRARIALKPVLQANNGSTAPVFYAVGNAHLDLAWLWPMTETYRKTARTFAAQLRHLEEYPDYYFLQSQPASYEMCRKYYPELFERVKKAIKGGRWLADGAMWVEPDTNMAGGEALIRQVLYGKKYFREELGVDSQLLWLPDTFGYSAVLPQILKKSGVKYLVTQKIFWSYNEGEQFPYHYFTWKGMDGSEVTSFLPTSYTYDTTPETLHTVWKKRVQKRDLNAFLLPFGYGDGGGGPSRDHIEYLEREKDLEGLPKVKMAGPVEFFRDMEAMGGPTQTYTGELYFSAHRGVFTSQAAVKYYNRKNELLLREAELWNSLAMTVSSHPYAYPAEELEKAWKTVLLHQFHDILPGSGIGRVYEDAVREHKKVETAGELWVGRALDSLTEGGCQSGSVSIFQSLSWDRTGVISLPAAFARGAVLADGRHIPVQKTDNDVLALVTVPSMGAITLAPAPSDSHGDPMVSLKKEEGFWILDNGIVRAAIDEMGQVVSFVKGGREFAAAPMNCLRMYKDIPRRYDAWDIDSNYGEFPVELETDVQVESLLDGGLRGELKVTRRLHESRMTQIIRLDAQSDTLVFDTAVDWKELHRLLKVEFPVDVETVEGINEIQFGYMKRPLHRSRQYDKDRFEVCNHRYTALCDESHGAAVLNDCKYGVSMSQKAAGGSSVELTLLRASASPEMRADNRVHHFVYGFMAWEGSFLESPVVHRGYELNVPMRTAEGTACLPSPFRLDQENVILETVKAAEDGSGDLILRLYESKHADTTVNLETRWDVERASICNMLEEEEETLISGKSGLSLHMKPFEIKTLRIGFGKRG